MLLPTGLVDPDLRPAIQDYFEKITTAELDDTHVEKSETSSGGKPLSEGVSEGGGETESASASKGGIVPPFVDNSNMEIILLLKPYTVILWKDTKMYYLFDCHSRDIEGNVFGASQWSEVMLCPARKKKVQQMFCNSIIIENKVLKYKKYHNFEIVAFIVFLYITIFSTRLNFKITSFL